MSRAIPSRRRLVNRARPASLKKLSRFVSGKEVIAMLNQVIKVGEKYPHERP